MVLDFCVLVLLLLYALLGFTRGLMAQLVGLVGIIAAWILAPLGAPIVRNLLFSSGTETWAHLEVASMMIAAIVVLICVQLLFRLIPDLLRRWSDSLRGVDTVLGVVFGAVRGAITAYLFLCAMVYAESPMVRRIPEMGEQMLTSRVVAEVRKNNLLTTLQFSDFDRLRRGLAAAGQKGADSADSAIASKLNDVPSFRAAARNAELRRLARDGRSSELLDHPMVHELMADPRVRNALGATPTPTTAPATAGHGRVEGVVKEEEKATKDRKKKKKKKAKPRRARRKTKARPVEVEPEDVDPGIDE